MTYEYGKSNFDIGGNECAIRPVCTLVKSKLIRNQIHFKWDCEYVTFILKCIVKFVVFRVKYEIMFIEKIERVLNTECMLIYLLNKLVGKFYTPCPRKRST